MTKLYDVAVVGATGAVGETMIEILEQRIKFSGGQFVSFGESSRSAGKTVVFKISHIVFQDLADFDFNQTQIGLFSAGGSISEEFTLKKPRPQGVWLSTILRTFVMTTIYPDRT